MSKFDWKYYVPGSDNDCDNFRHYDYDICLRIGCKCMSVVVSKILRLIFILLMRCSVLSLAFLYGRSIVGLG